jgi:RimJ/RimL family protein N-acetyltransferase
MGEVIIRKWKISDAESLQKNANNKSVSRFLLDRFPYPYTMESALNFLEFATNSPFKYLFAIEVDQELVGGIEIQLLTENYVNNGELGFWLGEAFWGQGIA